MNRNPHALAALLANPSEVESIQPEEIPALLCQLTALQGLLTSRLVAAPANRDASKASEGDVLLDVAEAAQKLGTTRDWLYRNATRLPFTVRLGRRQLRFSARGIGEFIHQRKGR